MVSEQPCRAVLSANRALVALSLTALLAFSSQSRGTSASPSLTEISTDPFSGTTSLNAQHHSEVEPDTFAYGNTEVADFQVGRIYDGGATTAGWATFSGGAWQHGLLPGLTKDETPAGAYPRVSDPSIAYDAKHGVWLASTLGIGGPSGDNVLINRSTDGVNWLNPVQVISSGQVSLDKDWIVCDNGASSPFRGNCYSTYDDTNAGDVLETSVSSDGGLTWGPERPARQQAAIHKAPRRTVWAASHWCSPTAHLLCRPGRQTVQPLTTTSPPMAAQRTPD